MIRILILPLMILLGIALPAVEPEGDGHASRDVLPSQRGHSGQPSGDAHAQGADGESPTDQFRLGERPNSGGLDGTVSPPTVTSGNAYGFGSGAAAGNGETSRGKDGGAKPLNDPQSGASGPGAAPRAATGARPDPAVGAADGKPASERPGAEPQNAAPGHGSVPGTGPETQNGTGAAPAGHGQTGQNEKK